MLKFTWTHQRSMSRFYKLRQISIFTLLYSNLSLYFIHVCHLWVIISHRATSNTIIVYQEHTLTLLHYIYSTLFCLRSKSGFPLHYFIAKEFYRSICELKSFLPLDKIHYFEFVSHITHSLLSRLIVQDIYSLEIISSNFWYFLSMIHCFRTSVLVLE